MRKEVWIAAGDIILVGLKDYQLFCSSPLATASSWIWVLFVTVQAPTAQISVAAISIGLNAWEILKHRHSSIYLILTELDLPSISGYALLTLIMEHDGCKDIPVIIMSSQDSISTVLNCFLKGAADYLIKPVRKNELKNLWRNVWKRLSSASTSRCMENLQGVSQMKHRKEYGLSHTEGKHEVKDVRAEETEDKPDKFGSIAQPSKEVNVYTFPIVEEDGSCTGVATGDRCVGPENHTFKANIGFEPLSGTADLIGSLNIQKGTMRQASSRGEFYAHNTRIR